MWKFAPFVVCVTLAGLCLDDHKVVLFLDNRRFGGVSLGEHRLMELSVGNCSFVELSLNKCKFMGLPVDDHKFPLRVHAVALLRPWVFLPS